MSTTNEPFGFGPFASIAHLEYEEGTRRVSATLTEVLGDTCKTSGCAIAIVDGRLVVVADSTR